MPVTIGSIAVNFVIQQSLHQRSNGIYYQKKGSVQLVDVDGKPVANQDVVLDIVELLMSSVNGCLVGYR